MRAHITDYGMLSCRLWGSIICLCLDFVQGHVREERGRELEGEVVEVGSEHVVEKRGEVGGISPFFNIYRYICDYPLPLQEVNTTM